MQKLENMQNERSSGIWIIFIFFAVFFGWASFFTIDKTVRSSGQVKSESRVQVIQSIDGGTIAEIYVKEGDVVNPGDDLVRFDQTRVEAQTNEIKARVGALKARVARLEAELTSKIPEFPEDIQNRDEIVKLEAALFEKRLRRLQDQAASQREMIELAEGDFKIVSSLYDTEDVSKAEYIDAKRAVLQARSELVAITNEYFESASQELVTAQNELAQNQQILTERTSVLNDSVLRSYVRGQVKNITLGNLGAVARPGDELMQIVPTGDTLFVETKIRPADIADVDVRDEVSLRFEAFDSSIFGSLTGFVTFVSGDTISEPAQTGSKGESFYVAHVSLPASELNKIVSSTGRELDLVPGMVVQADIQAGERTVLQYILRPVQKTLQNSLTEK